MKLHVKTILILVVITVIGVSGYFVWKHVTAPKKPEAKSKQELVTVDNLVKASIDTEAITANFSDGHFIQMKFKLIAKSETSAEEIKKLNFKTQGAIIQTINQIKMADAVGPKGFTLIEDNVKVELNKALGKGLITEVYLVEKLIQ
ncbi:MAG: flagellar basal body-associated protein FliL [Bacillales bacterium]|jgi:flagellar FliL protein|nr:flagellar basal body-associated protein FliL [Bacillales bacterium]